MSESSHFFSMLMSSSFNALVLEIQKSVMSYVILSESSETATSDHNLLRWLKCHDNALSQLNNTVIRISHSVNVNCDSIFRFATFSEVILMSHLMSENFRVIKWSYESRFDSCCRISVSLSWGSSLFSLLHELNILCWDLLDLLTELCLSCICMQHGPDCRKHQILSLIVLINVHTCL
jgi:hypothetical protein